MDIHEDIAIPDNHGKVFSTDAKDTSDLENIEAHLRKLSGIKDVTFNTEVFPVEFTVFTKEFMRVTDIQDQIKPTGFHALPKNLFPLEF